MGFDTNIEPVVIVDDFIFADAKAVVRLVVVDKRCVLSVIWDVDAIEGIDVIEDSFGVTTEAVLNVVDGVDELEVNKVRIVVVEAEEGRRHVSFCS